MSRLIRRVHGPWQISQQKISGATYAYTLTFPHSPFGIQYSLPEIDRLWRLLERFLNFRHGYPSVVERNDDYL